LPLTASESSMSSYPGQLASADDFYQLNSQIVVMETSDSIFNHALYDIVVPQSLFFMAQNHISQSFSN